MVFLILKKWNLEKEKDDWITLCTYCDYVDYDENNTNIKEVQDFLYKLLPHYERENIL